MKIILFGSTGRLGSAIATTLQKNNFEVTSVIRKGAAVVNGDRKNTAIFDSRDPSSLKGICNGHDVVISALGKSVSPSDRSRPSFDEVDLRLNSAILQDAKTEGVKKFIYISAFHAERYPDLEYFRVHEEFSKRVINSGLDYSIIKPPSLFSAYLEMLPMARKGLLFTFGDGSRKTNPIFEGDVAEIVVKSLTQKNAIIEAGGRLVYTRREINQIIQDAVSPQKKIRIIPPGLVRAFLPLLWMVDRNTYDKLAFILRVMEEDTIAPCVGEQDFATYIREKAASSGQ